MTRSGRLVRLSQRVLRLAGAPETAAQRTMAAVLDSGPGSALSHCSALAWWGVAGFQLDELHVTHARDGVHRPGRMAHQVHDVVMLPDHHVRVLEGVPVVIPARALFEIAGKRGINPGRVERAIDNAWAKRLVSGPSLHTTFDELAKRGRPGTRLMRELLRDRGAGYVPPAIGDDRGWIGRVDFADEHVPFILEVQSERFHTSLLDHRADKGRMARLRAAGYVVVEVSDTDVWHRKHHIIDTVRRGRKNERVTAV